MSKKKYLNEETIGTDGLVVRAFSHPTQTKGIVFELSRHGVNEFVLTPDELLGVARTLAEIAKRQISRGEK